MEAKMNRMIPKSVLLLGAALALLGGCASYDGYDSGYRGSAYYGGSYYGGGYYGPDYYAPYGYYGRAYIPRGSYGGGYHRGYRGGDRDHRDGNRDGGRREHWGRGDAGGQRSRDMSRSQPQQNTAPAQRSFSGGSRGGMGGSGGGASAPSRGGPEGRFGHPGTTRNPL
jgi:hypothetical protein